MIMADIVRNPNPWVPALGMVAVGAGVGAVIGAFVNRPCDNNGGYACGPGAGAVSGGVAGAMLTGVMGLGLAVFSKEPNDVRVRTAAIGIGVPLALGVAGQIMRTR